MTEANQGHSNESPGMGTPAAVLGSPAAPIFAVTFLAALGAAGAVFGLSDLVGLGVAALIAGAGATVAAMAARKAVSPTDAKASALLRAAMAEDAPAQPPIRFRGEPWFSLYARVAGYAEAQRAATLAIEEADRLRAELERVTGRRPSVSVESALGGEAAASGSAGSAASLEPSEAAASFEPRPVHVGRELVGGAPGPAAGEADVAGRVRVAIAEAMDPVARDLDAIVQELEPLLDSLRYAGSAEEASLHAHPAKMVDALVRTAADGIEDLAAGLMRANELASVAERVTNRATLLALNAALEATRSGSEAFASIAEETRRLAEFAREATDTISRLSNEIEIKVGETIASIQTGSQDAKAAVDSIRGGASSRPAVAPATLQKLDALLARVRTLRTRVATPVVADAPGEAPGAEEEGPSPESPAAVPAVAPADDTEAQPSYVTLDATAEAGAAEGAPSSAPPEQAEAAETPAPGDAPDAAGRVPAVPRVVEKIPDWMEGLEPRDRP